MEIKLKNSNLLKVQINDEDGIPTGEFLMFDIEDNELPLKFQEIVEKDKALRTNLKNQMKIIDKKEDVIEKNKISRNTMEKIKLINNFYVEEMKVLDIFLGENGCKKLLNGRKPYMEMFEDIQEVIKPVMDEIDKEIMSIEDRIKSKYKMSEDNVLE